MFDLVQLVKSFGTIPKHIGNYSQYLLDLLKDLCDNIFVMRDIKNYKEAMLRYYYAPMVGVWLAVAIVCGFVIGFDEVWRYWRVVGLNLM